MSAVNISLHMLRCCSLTAARCDRHEIADTRQAKVDGIVYPHPNMDKEGPNEGGVLLRGRLDS